MTVTTGIVQALCINVEAAKQMITRGKYIYAACKVCPCKGVLGYFPSKKVGI